MIIEILSEGDIDRVKDPSLQEYVKHSLARLPEGFDYFNHIREYGCFCVVTQLEDLTGVGIVLSHWVLPSMREEVFWERVELVEVQEDSGVVEVLVAVDTDVMVGLIMRIDILDENWRRGVMAFGTI